MVQTIKPVSFSQTWTFFEGDWHDGNVPIMGPRTHGAWLASTVFDGARAFEGTAPDLDRHCERVNQSAINFKLKPVVDSETWLALAREGIARFDANAELYIRPMYWAQTGSGGGVLFDPETTNWCMCIYVAPMPPTTGSAITLSPFRRPTMENAPVDCKASCLYPNNSRALIEAQARGFNNCLMLDMLGNVAEFRQRECLHGEGRRGVHAGAERNVPGRHHAAARDQPVVRGRRHRRRENPPL